MTRDEATEDGELRVALDGHRAGKRLREIAEDLYGAVRVAADWDADSWTRAETRRLVAKARSRVERDRVDGVTEAAADG